MFKNMKLSTKLYGGFTAVVLIAGVLGFVGWRSTSEMRVHMTTYSDWGQIDMVMNEGVIQKVLEVNHAMTVYGRRGNDENLKKLRDAVTAAGQGTQEWKELVAEHPDLLAVAEKASAFLSGYRKEVDGYVSARQAHSAIRNQWDTSIAEILSFLEKTMEEVIDPTKDKAAEAKDIDAMNKWGQIDMIMNEGVIANVLKWQTASHDYAAKPDKQSLKGFLAAQKSTAEGLDEWKGTLAGEVQMEQAAAEVTKRLEVYAALGHKYQQQVALVTATEQRVETGGGELLASLENGMVNVIDPAKDQAVQEAESAQSTATWLVGCLSLAGVLIGAVLAVTITRGLTKPINRIVQGLNNGAEQTSSASGQVASASQSLAQGTSEQAAAVEEVTSSIEEMASMTKQNASNANEAKSLAASATAATDRGTEAMGRMSSAIEDIKKSSDETAKIIKTIDEIAFQTNLLALNAAVEAARAGEAGKGFAVVAEEVRNLAQRSAQAARDTAEMIEGSVKNADNGVTISKEVATLLDEIAENNSKVNDLVGEISAASNEQSQGIEQINTAVGQMDSVTQSNAANAEESASAAEELSAQAEQLSGMVEELQSVVGGSNAAQGGGNLNFHADHHDATAVHQTLHQAPKAQPSKTSPKRATATVASTANEEAIPMDDDDTGLASF